MMKNLIIAICIILCNQVLLKSQNCLNFDSKDYVYIGDACNLEKSDFTVEAWIYVNNNSSPHKIINKGGTQSGTPKNAGYFLRTSAPWVGKNSIEFTIAGSKGKFVSVISNTLKIKQWIHVAGVRKGKELKLFIDGKLVDTQNTDTVYDTNTNVPLTIGALNRVNGRPIGEFMNGKIDEVRIWNVARTQKEINSNKDCAITSSKKGLVAVYNLDASTGNIVLDKSGNDNNGVLKSTPIREVSEVAPECKKIEQGLEKAIKVKSKSVSIKIWDDAKEDGDIVSVFLNGIRIKKELTVKKQEQVILIELNEGENIFKLLAHNEGSSSPNTAAILVDDGENEYQITLSCKKDEFAILKIKY